MENKLKYTVFDTNKGYFGLLAGRNGLVRTSLPVRLISEAKKYLLCGINGAVYEEGMSARLQKDIKAYFEGICVDLSDVKVDLSGLTEFGSDVLNTCRGVKYGQIVTYGQLAALADRPGASRAVGNILAKNPVPLIVPCHRILRSDGRIGGFSAAGGSEQKKFMLELESGRSA